MICLSKARNLFILFFNMSSRDQSKRIEAESFPGSLLRSVDKNHSYKGFFFSDRLNIQDSAYLLHRINKQTTKVRGKKSFQVKVPLVTLNASDLSIESGARISIEIFFFFFAMCWIFFFFFGSLLFLSLFLHLVFMSLFFFSDIVWIFFPHFFVVKIFFQPLLSI